MKNLFLEGVQLWTALKNQGLPSSLKELTGEPLRLVIEMPSYWEYRLFSQVLKDKIASFANLKTDRKLGFASGRYEHVDSANVLTWLSRHVGEVRRKIEVVNSLFAEDQVDEAFGPVGVPGVAEKIVYLADRLAERYRDLIEWSLQCYRVVADDEFGVMLGIMTKFVDNPIRDIEEFSERLDGDLESLLTNPPQSNETRTINAILTLSAPSSEVIQAYEVELSRLAEVLQRALHQD